MRNSLRPVHLRRPMRLRRPAPLAAGLATLTLAGTAAAAAASLTVAPAKIGSFSHSESVPVSTCTKSATADTYTNQGSTTTNYGSQPDLRVSTGTGTAARTFVRFDLASCAIPTTAVVQFARLRLYLATAPSSSRTYSAFRLTSTWAESSLTWSSSQPTASGTATASVSTGTAGGVTLEWNVKADAQEHVSTPTSNHGWTIRDASESNGPTVTGSFSAREHGTAAQHPTLVVTYYP